MNVTTGWEALPVDELDPMAKVKMLPERYFSFLGNRMGNSQQIGSLLTAENLKAIKKYVNVVNQLPRTQAEIEREVDYGALGVDVTMVNDLYVALHRHVYEWDILERSIKQLGPEIELFAESLVQRGGNLLDNLENSEVFAALKSARLSKGVMSTRRSSVKKSKLRSQTCSHLASLNWSEKSKALSGESMMSMRVPTGSTMK